LFECTVIRFLYVITFLSLQIRYLASNMSTNSPRRHVEEIKIVYLGRSRSANRSFKPINEETDFAFPTAIVLEMIRERQAIIHRRIFTDEYSNNSNNNNNFRIWNMYFGLSRPLRAPNGSVMLGFATATRRATKYYRLSESSHYPPQFIRTILRLLLQTKQAKLLPDATRSRCDADKLIRLD